jgi:hypothetical protein
VTTLTPPSVRAFSVPKTAWSTPKRLRAFIALVWIGAALLLLVGESTLDRARHATKTIQSDAAPSIIAALEIRALLADLDANAANVLLDSPDHVQQATALFEDERTKASTRLVEAAQNITFGDSEKIPIVAIATDLGRYLELFGEARYRYASKDAAGALAAYRQATDLMHTKILPAAEALDKANKDVMNDVYDHASSAEGGSEAIAVLCGGLLVFVLAWAQLFVFRRTRRVFNVPLAIATVLALVFTTYLVTRFGAARADLKTAKEDAFESIHALWKARAIAYDANGDESRFLVDGERERLYGDAFKAKVSTLTTAPEFKPSDESEVRRLVAGRQVTAHGLFADEFNNLTFEGEREAAIAMAKAFATYYATDGQLRALQAKGDRAGAVRLCLGRSNDEFANFDRATLEVIKVNMTVFQRVLSAGDRGLKNAEVLDPLFAIAIAILGWLGLRARIREYR